MDDHAGYCTKYREDGEKYQNIRTPHELNPKGKHVEGGAYERLRVTWRR
jgi:hypothetical protein